MHHPPIDRCPLNLCQKCEKKKYTRKNSNVCFVQHGSILKKFRDIFFFFFGSAGELDGKKCKYFLLGEKYKSSI